MVSSVNPDDARERVCVCDEVAVSEAERALLAGVLGQTDVMHANRQPRRKSPVSEDVTPVGPSGQCPL